MGLVCCGKDPKSSKEVTGVLQKIVTYDFICFVRIEPSREWYTENKTGTNIELWGEERGAASGAHLLLQASNQVVMVHCIKSSR